MGSEEEQEGEDKGGGREEEQRWQKEEEDYLYRGFLIGWFMADPGSVFWWSVVLCLFVI